MKSPFVTVLATLAGVTMVSSFFLPPSLGVWAAPLALILTVVALFSHALGDSGPSAAEVSLAVSVWKEAGLGCLGCNGSGHVPNAALLIFEPCPHCNPAQPQSLITAGPRQRPSALSERVAT